MPIRYTSVKIHNIISTADLGQKVEITKFNQFAWGRYDVENNYNGRVGYVKDDTMIGRVTVFSSGKMISTGAKSVSESIDQLHKTMNLLVDNKFAKLVELTAKIQNIVATLDIKNKIDINVLSIVLPKIIYEPDQFPGAILRTSNGPVCLIFSTGKIVIVGSKSEGQMSECANFMVKKLDEFLNIESDKKY